ncbi:Ubiquinone biosynthesis accessory factor UbiK [Sinobacterium norvegicum]|uniref:Ubiquinone biosynthesis accessory factor UbiK n=1 Tax=Sinobacterium norvegicum TaxID=1641715 RepID=A0ABN8ELN0_9GAMM|nr:accessory factor UbiK family protein [Sinobacterium norvegicum]CAH0991792.1 Ubiquinone biosynthesis accessory factor UbiK [Sinobacterium norvegicum]
MLNNQFIDEFSQQLSQLLKGAPQRQDIEKAVHAASQSVFSKLNLVSREEFDAQAAVLQRSRQKLNELEQQLAELNEKIK